MKKTIQIILSCALVLGAVSCAEEFDKHVQPSAPVTLVADIVNESGTKATLDDASGAFAFSAGDQIKVYNGTVVKNGTTAAGGASATFEMEEGFENTGSGFAGFPAAIVGSITAGGVTFVLPASYTYAQVGDSDPDAAKVSCPMLASFNAGSSLSFKQAGSVVRIRVTNIAEGTLSFTFPTNVTGTVTLDAVPSASDGGILATNLTGAGKTITVSGVPEITTGNYAYITLPLPTATAPENIMVVNNPADASASRMAAIEGSATALERAGGYKLSVSPAEAVTPSFKVSTTKSVVIAPGNLMAHVASYTGGSTATADSWKFGGYFECLGAATDGGNYLFAQGTSFTDKWLDLFSWQGNSASTKVNGLVNLHAINTAYHGNSKTESTYNGCWNGLDISNGGDYTWRTMTKDEWEYLLLTRTTSTLNSTSNARFARATVAGVNGLLIFPDNVGETWNDATMGSKPSGINTTTGAAHVWGTTNTYSAANFVAMYGAGIVFIPNAGYRASSGALTDAGGSSALYWANTAHASSSDSAYRLYFAEGELNLGYAAKRYAAFPVRLVREI